jgi:hypothetical protein
VYPLRKGGHVALKSTSPKVYFCCAATQTYKSAKNLKNCLRVLSIHRKRNVFVLFFIIRLKIDVCHFKNIFNKNFLPTTPSEKYIPGKQCPKLQEYAVLIG